MLNDTACGWLIQPEVFSLRVTGLGVLYFFEVLLDSNQLPKNRVVFCVDIVQAKKRCPSKPRGLDMTVKWYQQNKIDSIAYVTRT